MAGQMLVARSGWTFAGLCLRAARLLALSLDLEGQLRDSAAVSGAIQPLWP
jgi:hypothetical protein